MRPPGHVVAYQATLPENINKVEKYSYYEYIEGIQYELEKLGISADGGIREK